MIMILRFVQEGLAKTPTSRRMFRIVMEFDVRLKSLDVMQAGQGGLSVRFVSCLIVALLVGTASKSNAARLNSWNDGPTKSSIVHFVKAAVAEWIESARHPKFDRPYSELVYKPMLDLLDYLRATGFETWIVSGGRVEFMRVFSERVYGIPPQQVVGSTITTKSEMRAEGPVLV